jgi:hypothetical protein
MKEKDAFQPQSSGKTCFWGHYRIIFDNKLRLKIVKERESEKENKGERSEKRVESLS